MLGAITDCVPEIVPGTFSRQLFPAVEPVIGHMKQDNGLGRCWLKGTQGDALNAVLSAAGYNLRWMLRAIAGGRIKLVFLRLLQAWLEKRIGRWNCPAWPPPSSTLA